jgi:Heterokaryon incompatibility protein (HET)
MAILRADPAEAEATFRRLYVDNAPASEEILQALAVLGPDQAPAWILLENVNTFCERCANLDWQPAEVYLAIADGYSFYPKIPLFQTPPKVGQVRQAAHEGCHLCTLILTCLITTRYRASIEVDPLGEGIHSIDDGCEIDVQVQATALDPPVYLYVSLQDSGRGVSGWLTIGLPIVSLQEHPDEDQLNNYDGDSSDNTLSTVCLGFASPAEAIARYWLDDCRMNHGVACNECISNLPKRVLDVQSRTLPFLFDTNRIPGEYATLSYCWGRSATLKTQKSTMQEHEAGIRMDGLSQTVQDAIWWTRQLGLQYLWVDALCIIQDDPLDLEMELSLMAEIYKNSTITIAATAAVSTSEGCLPNRNKLTLAPCCPTSSIVIQPNYERKTWIYQKGALEERAWTFQEVQLSRRILRVGGEELAWQCRECKRREGNPLAKTVHDRQATGTSFGTRALDDPDRLKNGNPFILWYQLVQQYLTRSLSFSEDKLPAFSGMASHFAAILRERRSQTTGDQERHSSGYVAGLWEEDLLHGLLWRTITHLGHHVPYRAPSWSWAAFESKIVYHAPGLQVTDFHTEVLGVDVTVPGFNPYGKVTCGKLTLLGPTAPVPSQVYDDDSEVGVWKWRWPLVTWEHEGPPKLGCVCLRLQKACCLILAPIDRRRHEGIFRRVGMLVTPTELEDPEGIKMQILDQLEWKERIITIV